MDLLIVRHADAGDPKQFGAATHTADLRPLSNKGRKQMRTAALALRELVPSCDTIASSPLKRAVQTAELLCAAYGLESPQTTEALVPGAALAEFEQWATQFGDTECIAIVGHEPHLSTLVTWLMTATQGSRIAMKKGSACFLEFNGPVRAGSGTLRWLLTPRLLDALAGSAT